jgi:hypothetical protein
MVVAQAKTVTYFGFRLLFSIWPLFLGMFLHTVEIFGQRFINLFWGVIYGLGMLVTDVIFGNSVESPLLFIGILWPICMTVLLFVSGGKIWRAKSPVARWVFVALFALSSFLVIDLRDYAQPPYSKIPTFLSLMSEVY